MIKVDLDKIWSFLIKSKLSLLFLPVTLVYFLITQIRFELYNRGILKRNSPEIDTICVGNISVGGNGKTPLTLYLAKLLHSDSQKTSILTRGYGGLAYKTPHLLNSFDDTITVGDEGIIYRESLKHLEIPVVVSKDRVSGAKFLKVLGANVALMDDGFQHFKIQPKATLCLIDIDDAESYLNYSILSLFPSGIFREHPEQGLKRAGRVVFTKRGALTDTDKTNIMNLAKKFNLTNYSTILIKPDKLIDGFNGDENQIPNLDSEIISLSSISKPDAFIQNLKSLGYIIKKSFIFKDHHQFQEAEIKDILSKEPDTPIVCTYKDMVKIKSWINTAGRVFYLEQKVEDVSKDHQSLINWLRITYNF